MANLHSVFYRRIKYIFQSQLIKHNLKIKGIEVMNDDPYMTDIVYAKVQDPDELLQAITDDIIQQFIDVDLAKLEYDRTKLHCTIMNSAFNVNPETGKRKQFNAAEFIRDETFQNFNFGRVVIDRKGC